MKTIIVAALAVLAHLGLLAPAAAAPLERTAVRDFYDGRVVVMTRNVYIGADIFRVIEVDPINTLPEIAAVYATVQQTNFTERAEALADEIMSVRPHLIGLQEVTLLRRQTPGDIFFGELLPNATEVESDYLQILIDALAARGLYYSAAAVVVNADVEVPLITDTTLDDIRLTDRDVILVRGDVTVDNIAEFNFDDFVSFDVSGIDVAFKRGVVAVDATVRNRTYRFVNTHLEVSGEQSTQALQAEQLINYLADEQLPVILVGDLNSPPGATATQPYPRLVEEGFEDAWELRRGSPDDGLTCCHDEELDNETPQLSSRIDHILVRASSQSDGGTTAVSRVVSIVVGDEVEDRTPSGLWPSDHAGVAAMMMIRPERGID